jgi:hypoxanthine phosphoribosyltransferase
VDDAVDTGTTLSVVMDAVRRHAPQAAKIRSAAITVTTERPLISPDYALYYRQLCRFPWSLDATTSASRS